MRLIWVTVLCGFFLLGCQHPRSGDAAAPTPAPKPGVSAPATTPRSGPQVMPTSEPSGRVALVNPALRYVVVDFYLSPLPPIGQVLSVYRQGQKVAEVKITGPERSRNIAADIVAGEIRIGDEVRVD